MKTLILLGAILLGVMATNTTHAQRCSFATSDSAYYINGRRVSNATTVIEAKKLTVMVTYTGRAFNNSTLLSLPNRNVNAIANTVAGVVSYGGQTPSIRGAAPSGTAYYVDGIRVYGALPVSGR